MDLVRAKTILKTLTDAMERLEANSHRMQLEFNRAVRKDEVGSYQCARVVGRWLEEVDCVEEEVRAIESEYERRRSSGILVIPNYVGIYRIANRADKLIQKVMELRRARVPVANSLVACLDDEAEGLIVRKRIASSYPEEIVWGCVVGEEEEVERGIVGIAGVGGVGKTSLLEAIRDTVGGRLFDHVIYIVVSEHSLEKLQKNISKILGLPTSSYDSDTRAAVIFYFLKERNFLLLLDDLPEALDLDALGIPDPYTSNPRRRQKVVLTTRSWEVCTRMKSHKMIEMAVSNQSDSEVVTTFTEWILQSGTTTAADTREPDITSSSVNIHLIHENKNNNRIAELELKKSQAGTGEPNFHNKYNEESRGQNYQTTSEEEQTKSNDGSQISNFREEWRSLEVLYSDIKDATNGFSQSSEIGKGGYGNVYKGKLGGTMVAIKMLDSTSKQGEKEFFQELEVLYQMRHPNLVKLVGACFEVNALVYEFLPNGSLEDCLKYTPNILTWQMRTRIIYEICSSLIYLHSKSVIHGDLKPANVLLDANFKSKLSDFGLCRLLPEEMTTAVYLVTVPKGTSGYVDPWFLKTWILRPGSDLYSFGITILKLLTGKPPIGLGVIARDADENSFREMIDPTAGSWPFELATELLYWSLQCCYHNEKSLELLKDMSTCFEEMLTEIETFQEGRFKVVMRQKKAVKDSLNAEEEEEEKMKEEEKPKVEEKKEEPALIAVVLKVHMHSEAYAQEITRKILGLEGIHAVELALKASKITVKGVFDLLKLVEYIHREIGKPVEIVKVELVGKKPEEERPKEGEKVKD